MTDASPTRPGVGDRADQFAAERPRLVGLAYRILGSRADAEDIVQDAWLRYDSTSTEPDNAAAWLTTVVTRLAIDRLRSAPRRRETYVGPWLPEPALTAVGGVARDEPGRDPADLVDRAASLTLGFLVVLDTLGPEDRAVFLLADIFGVPFAEVADIVGRSPEACRQAASRARRRLREAHPANSIPAAETWELATRLAVAVGSGDLEGTMALLDPEVVLVSDGGAERHAARRPVVGADRVARFLVNTSAKLGEAPEVDLVEVNGGPGMVVRQDGRADIVVTFEAGPSGVNVLRMVLAPAKLRSFDLGIVD